MGFVGVKNTKYYPESYAYCSGNIDCKDVYERNTLLFCGEPKKS